MNVDIAKQPQKILSMCTGIRGIERGLERAGVQLQPVVYLEIEAFVIANLVAAMEAGLLDPTPIWTDAKTFDARPFRGRIHGIIGGYPCTPFSLAGQRKGENDERHLWPYISAAISSIEPLWCFFENVDDHLTMGFDIVYKDLQRMGYSVEAGIYTAEEVGAPHERERIFILAISNRINWGLPETKKWIESLQVTRSGKEIWPAGQGYYQHEWEEPRQVESGLGCTVNGYNFREDLLRALGNSVVEQTAELAFIDLLNKHLKNLK